MNTYFLPRVGSCRAISFAFLRPMGAVAMFWVAACGASGRSAAPTEAPPTKAPPLAALVNASIVVGRCPDARRMNGKLAESAVHALVDSCNKVPGGSAHFSATLLPGGRVDLAASNGDPAEGVLPLCVLRHPLTHRVELAKPCQFDVRLEDSQLPLSATRTCDGGEACP